MAAMANAPRKTIGYLDDALELRIDVNETGTARIMRLVTPQPAREAVNDPAGGATPAPSAISGSDVVGALGEAAEATGLPLADVIVAGEGRTWSGSRYCESVAGARLRYLGHDSRTEGPGSRADRWHQLRVDLGDPVSGLHAEIFYRILAGCGVLRSWVRLTNQGARPLTIEAVTSFLCGAMSSDAASYGASSASRPDDLDAFDVLWAENDWLAEGRWQRRALRDALPDLNRSVHGADPRGRFGVTSVGTWSCGTYLPMGAIVNRRAGQAWVWQIEHNGPWHWQVGGFTRRDAGNKPRADATGENPGGLARSAYVALLGPTDAEHHWRISLAPNDAFITVPTAIVSTGLPTTRPG